MNNAELKAAAKIAVAQVLNPLARLLLDIGLGAREFQEIARLEFVRAAVAKGTSSDPAATSDSDVAVLTGLTRRDVARLRAQEAERDEGSDVGRHRAERVLSAWCHDPEFQDGLGNPARLPLRGERCSFRALVRKHSADPRARTILKELERVRAVRRDADGKVEVVRRTYAPVTFSPDGIRDVGQQVHDHLQTLVHNLKHPKRQLYQRRALNRSLTLGQAGILMRYIAQQADAAMDSLDVALNDPPADGSEDAKRGDVRLGVGFHMFREPIEEELPAATHSTAKARAAKRGKATRRRRTTK